MKVNKIIFVPILVINLVLFLSACAVSSNGGGGSSGIDMVGTYNYTITDSGCGTGVEESGTIQWSYNSTSEIYTVTITSSTGLNVDDCTNTTEVSTSITFSGTNPIEAGEVADNFFDLLTQRGFPNPSSGSSQTTSEDFSNDLLETATYTRIIDGDTTITMIVTP